MYIIELLIQAFKKKRKTKQESRFELPENEIEDNTQNCEHFFMPLDSSNEFFACKYCGLVIPKEKLKPKNIFETKKI